MILVGDIGGTNTRLALIDDTGGRLAIRHRAERRNEEQASFEQIVRRFLEPLNQKVSIACFGVAGPVKNGAAKLTNLNWNLSESALASALGMQRVLLINDLVAHAENIEMLGADDVVTLHAGAAEKNGTRAMIAPGTGLGEAGLVYNEHAHNYRAFASEGGHCDFSPRDEREIELLKFVRRRHGRCSWEDVLSGPGLRTIFDFLIDCGDFHVAAQLEEADPEPEQISRTAVDGKCPACVAAVEMFATLCGSEAANLALKMLSTGGIWIGGGIAPNIIEFLKRPQVHEAFTAKGAKNIDKVLAAIPIHVITSTDTALYGAASYALRA